VNRIPIDSKDRRFIIDEFFRISAMPGNNITSSQSMAHFSVKNIFGLIELCNHGLWMFLLGSQRFLKSFGFGNEKRINVIHKR
jgi:hypothetical protein